MAAGILPYSIGEDVAKGTVDFDTHSFKIMLLGPGYSVNKANDRRNDIESSEVSATGTNYTTGGEDIAVTSVTRSGGVTSATFAASTTFASITAGTTTSSSMACIYRVVGGASSGDPLVCYIDFGGNVAFNGQDFVVNITSALTITVPA